jgi:hypothetical protein
MLVCKRERERSDVERGVGGMRMRLTTVHRDGPMLHGVAEYEADGRHWRHGPFTSRILDNDELNAALAEAGLRIDGWLDDRRSWAGLRALRWCIL